MKFIWGCMFLLLASCVPYTATGTPTSEPTLTLIPSKVAITKQSPTSTNISNPTQASIPAQTEVVEDNVIIFNFEQVKPLPGESNMVHGKVFLDSAEIKESRSESKTVILFVRGSLPTPCSLLRAKIEPPDSANKIVIDIYSLQNPDVMCIQSLAPFEVELPIENLKDGSYSVEINKLHKVLLDWPQTN